MGERKGLVTYISPDYDPALVPKSKKKTGGAGRETVRLELPFSMQCTACFEYLYKGRKYNAKKEVVTGETYLGMKILRFYIRCSRCSSQLTFKTDPQNSSYTCENGVTKNYEEWHANKAILDAAAAQEALDDLGVGADGSSSSSSGGAAMKALERKTLGNLEEMETLDALARTRAKGDMKDLLVSNPLGVLQALHSRHKGKGNDEEVDDRQEQGDGALNESGLTISDEMLLRSIKFKRAGSSSSSSSSNEESEEEEDKYRSDDNEEKEEEPSSEDTTNDREGDEEKEKDMLLKAIAPVHNPVVVLARKRRRCGDINEENRAHNTQQLASANATTTDTVTATGTVPKAVASALGALGAYDSDSGSD